MMPRHFAGLDGAATLATAQFQLTARIVADLIAARRPASSTALRAPARPTRWKPRWKACPAPPAG
jgi:hypothetical protein